MSVKIEQHLSNVVKRLDRLILSLEQKLIPELSRIAVALEKTEEPEKQDGDEG